MKYVNVSRSISHSIIALSKKNLIALLLSVRYAVGFHVIDNQIVVVFKDFVDALVSHLQTIYSKQSFLH